MLELAPGILNEPTEAGENGTVSLPQYNTIKSRTVKTSRLLIQQRYNRYIYLSNKFLLYRKIHLILIILVERYIHFTKPPVGNFVICVKL